MNLRDGVDASGRRGKVGIRISESLLSIDETGVLVILLATLQLQFDTVFEFDWFRERECTNLSTSTGPMSMATGETSGSGFVQPEFKALLFMFNLKSSIIIVSTNLMCLVFSTFAVPSTTPKTGLQVVTSMLVVSSSTTFESAILFLLNRSYNVYNYRIEFYTLAIWIECACWMNLWLIIHFVNL